MLAGVLYQEEQIVYMITGMSVHLADCAIGLGR